MAEKKYKSQAEKAAAASSGKKKNTKSVKTSKSEAKQKKETVQKTKLPARLVSSVVCIILFILFIIVLIEPNGALIKFFRSVVFGLIGQVGFGVGVPALLYLFYIHAFSGKRPVVMRTICLISFVLICGACAHILTGWHGVETGFGYVEELWAGSLDGRTGGVVCGGIALLLTSLLGNILSVIVLIVAGVLTLLASMQITIPSIVRAIQERPRGEWEDEEEEERPEPAAVVVNHIANKHIEHKRQKREAIANKEIEDKNNEERATEIMSQIGSNVDEPVVAATTPFVVTDEPEIITGKTPEIKPAQPPVEPVVPDEAEEEFSAPELEVEVPDTKKQKVTAEEAAESAAKVAEEIAASQVEVKPEYHFPPIDLLKLPTGSAGNGTAEMMENTRRLNETLASFKIEAHIINVTRGPSVTRYEVELEKGVRLNKLTTAADDIALSLGATGVRIAAIPGKISVVGIEVPNIAVTTVSLREVIDSTEFDKAKSKSSFAVGKDIGGSCIVGNIAKLPHMLIAGTTGSGKSVCMNSIIISLLYKASPNDVKLIMVDPKMVELGIYNGIPHLLIPVVTDPKKAAGSLQWAVTEMMRRYKAMSDAGVRDLESYNSIMEAEGSTDAKLPQVVVIIDELADLMLVAAKEVEESICRIAQMGRAAGIHLIIATQRPSADVITGLMKANIPSRIAFAVASAMESRIILDTQGAEKLVGKGDMLYAPIGDGKPRRVQGCFVSDPEVEAVASFVKNNSSTNYDQSVMEEIERKAAQTGNGKTGAPAEAEPVGDELGGDEMLPAAVEVILETGQASVSMLQRRLKLGYARAARIVDEMEERGIVGPFAGSKPREILVTKEQWENMCSAQPTQMEFSDLEDSDMAD